MARGPFHAEMLDLRRYRIRVEPGCRDWVRL